MNLIITFKLVPDSPEEAAGSLQQEYQQMREVLEKVAANGAFGAPERVKLRWLLEFPQGVKAEESLVVPA